jgi:hypothetical protein
LQVWPHGATLPTPAIPLQALTGPEGSRRLRLPDFKTISTWRWQGCQPYVPAAFTPSKYSWYSFLIEAESTPGPQCDRKDVNKKSSDTIGNLTHDLPVCSAVPQPLRHRVPPTHQHKLKISQLTGPLAWPVSSVPNHQCEENSPAVHHFKLTKINLYSTTQIQGISYIVDMTVADTLLVFIIKVHIMGPILNGYDIMTPVNFGYKR